MSNINTTLITALDSKTLQAYMNALPMPLTYRSYFPLVKNPFFSWKTLSNQLSKPNVAADLRAQNATNARKQRPVMQSATGDLPLMSISREMQRGKIKEYQIALQLAKGNVAATEIVKYWADDAAFCYNGIHSQYEYIAWALLSNAGKLAFTKANNAYFANEFDLDYQVDDAQKTKNTVAWATAATATPIQDFQKVIKDGKKIGLNLKHVWMSQDDFYLLQATTQMRELTKIYISGNATEVSVPDLEQINMAIKKVAYLAGLTIHVVDQEITRELADGTQTTENPFKLNTSVFTETTTMGSSQYSTLEESAPNVISAVRENAVIKKYSTPEPLVEVTIAESDGIPVLDSAYRNWYLNTAATAW